MNKSNPNNLLVLNNLAWSLFESKDSRALGFAEQALKLKPDNPDVMDTLGWILVQQGQAERGIKLLQQALSKAPMLATSSTITRRHLPRTGIQLAPVRNWINC